MAETSIIGRVLAAARYAFTGTAPDNWFGPGQPMAPQAPAEVGGRQYDYPTAINLNYLPRSEEPVGFAKLKALAQNCDVLRIVIEGQKRKIETVEWAIKPKGDAKVDPADPSILAIQAQLEQPDRNLDWPQWLAALTEQLFVLDAVSIYRRKTLSGVPYSFEIIDGATIKVLLDQSGRRPAPPLPAYQQILKGIVAADFSTDELLYYPQNVRPDRAYGYSRVEQIVNIVEAQIERLKSQKGFFTHGNLSDGFFEAPAGTTPDQVRQVEDRWNSLLGQGDVAARRMNQFLPQGFKWNAIGAPPLQNEFDQWLAQLICANFNVSSQPFTKQAGMTRAGAEQQHEASEAVGLASLMSYVRRIVNRLIREDFGRTDLEFVWVEDREFDPQTAATIQNEKLRNGTLTINEARDRDGLDPVDGGDVPLIYTSTGAVRLQDVIADKPEVEAPLPVPEGAAPVETPPEPSKKKSDGDLAKAATAAATEKALTETFTTYLAAKGAEIGKQLGDALGLKKVAPADDSNSDFSGRIDHALDDVDWDWTDLVDMVEPSIAGLAVAAGKTATSDLGLFDKDVLAKMTERAEAWAEARAAEMVGRKLVDGELVENEGWSIPAATRDMVRSAVTQAMESGASNQELAKTIRESEAFSPTRATMIARTETAMAEVQGTIAGWKASGLVAGMEWEAAPDCCDECQEMDGKIVALDEGFPDGDPPLHPSCFPGDTLVLAEGISAVSERPFEGDVVVIGTASGKRLTCTPNHPILTSSGWVAAGCLNVGGDVISSQIGNWMAASAVGDDAENMPARIEDVAKACRRSGQMAAVEVPVSTPDFHGDGEGSEIAIIWSNRLLMDRANAASCKHCGKPLFFGRNVELTAHDRPSVLDLFLDRFGAAEAGSVSLGEPGLAGLADDTLPLQRLCLASTAPLNSVLSKDATDGAAANAELVCNGLFGSAGGVEATNFSLVDRDSFSDGDAPLLQRGVEHVESDPGGLGGLRRGLAGEVSADSLVDLVRRRLGASDVASLTQGSGDRSLCAAELGGDLAERFAAQIFRDHIVDVRFERFAGHVFNLETKAGFYIAEGVIVHNCRCAVTPVLTDEMPDTGDEEA